MLHNGDLRIQEDGLTSVDWKFVAHGPFDDFKISGNRIGALQNGNLYIKVGEHDGPWFVTENVSAFDLTSPSGELVTLADLKAIYGNVFNEPVVSTGLPSLNDAMSKAGITTPARKAAFVATLLAESGVQYNRQEGGNPDTYRGRAGSSSSPGWRTTTGRPRGTSATTSSPHRTTPPP